MNVQPHFQLAQPALVLNLPAFGCNSRTAYSFTTLSSVSVKVVHKLAQNICPQTYEAIKHVPHDQPRQLSALLNTLQSDPAKDFIPSIYWIHQLLDSEWVERLKQGGHKMLSDESESDFLFNVLVNDPDSFLRAIQKLSSNGLSKGKKYVMFTLNVGEKPKLSPRFQKNASEVKELFLRHSKEEGYGENVKIEEYKDKDMIGYSIERCGHRKNAPKEDASGVLKAVTQRDVKVDLVFFHVSSQAVYVSCAYPRDVEFLVILLETGLFGEVGKFGQRRVIKTNFLGAENLKQLLASASGNFVKAVRLKEVYMKKGGLQPKKEGFHAMNSRDECLSDDVYQEFNELRKNHASVTSF